MYRPFIHKGIYNFKNLRMSILCVWILWSKEYNVFLFPSVFHKIPVMPFRVELNYEVRFYNDWPIVHNEWTIKAVLLFIGKTFSNSFLDQRISKRKWGLLLTHVLTLWCSSHFCRKLDNSDWETKHVEGVEYCVRFWELNTCSSNHGLKVVHETIVCIFQMSIIVALELLHTTKDSP